MNLPQGVVTILNASCTKSTWSRYDGYLKKFEKFCIEAGLDYVTPSISSVLQFLSSMFEKGLGYSSINTARSAISSFYGKIEGENLCDHRLLRQFMKGVSKLRPPTPKYSTTWDVDNVLDRFASWEDNGNLNLYDLSVKLSSLLALVSGQRVQSLHAINIDDILVESKIIRIVIKENLKTSGVGVEQPCIHIQRSYKRSKLCVARCLMEYLDRTKMIRGDCKQLFLTTRQPYRNASKQTISHWLMKALEVSNIDTSLYKSHSYRHASTSKAFRLGLKVSTIYQNAGWSKKSSVFFRYYNKNVDPLANTKLEFCNTLLQRKK